MVQMLPQSCDPGYGELGIQLGGNLLSQQADLFGYNAVPPIDLPYVVKSTFPTASDLSGANQAFVAYSSIGQYNVRATALQNAMVAEGIADTGVVMTPHVMAAIHNSASGALVEDYKPTVFKTASTPAAAQSVKKLMEGVVTTPRGTAAGVGFLPQDQVAVKTGTAQEGNAAQNTNDWMIGLAPASDPTVAVAVVVPQQATTFSGARIAGPIVKAMIEATLAEQARHPSAPAAPAGTTTTTSAPAPYIAPATTTPAPATTGAAPTTATATTTTTAAAATPAPTTTVPTTAAPGAPAPAAARTARRGGAATREPSG